MITVFHCGDAPQILATLTGRGIAFTEYNLRACSPEAGWAATMHLREIGRADQQPDGTLVLRTPTTTIDNALGRAVIAGDYPETVLAKLPPVEPGLRYDPPSEDELAAEVGAHVEELLAEAASAEPRETIHERREDGRCSCKTGKGAEIVKAALAPVCPECRAGKHRNCDGVALDEATDEIVPCTCPPAFGHEPRQVQP